MKPSRNGWFFGALVWALLVSALGGAQAADAVVSTPGAMDMVWVDSNEARHDIRFSTWNGAQWSDPMRVTNDAVDNLAPCIDTGADGKKHLVWMAVDATGHRVKHAVFDGSKWSEPEVIPTLPAVSGAPFVVADDNGVVWVVFAGNDGEDDDVYCTRLINGTWTVYQQVNVDNESPDIHPFIEITTDKKVVVTWQGYRDTGYVTLQSLWQGGKWQAETVVNEEAAGTAAIAGGQAEEAGLPLPDFVGDARQVFIRTNGN